MSTFTAEPQHVGYVEPMRDPAASLRWAIDEYKADAPTFPLRPIKARTIEKYDWYLYRFDTWKMPNPPTFREWRSGAHGVRTMGDLNATVVRSFIRMFTLDGRRSAAADATTTLRALAKYCAATKVWYARDLSSVLTGISVPQPSEHGRPTLSDDEMRTIHRVASEGERALLDQALLLMAHHGLRPDEVRRLGLDDVEIPGKPSDRGSIWIRQAKTPYGIRQIPLEPASRNPVLRYRRDGRASYVGCLLRGCEEHPLGPTTPEPLFVTDHGQPFHAAGWKSWWRRFSARVGAAGVEDFCAYRLRGTRVRELKDVGWSDSEVIQVMGWSPRDGQRMLRRYLGEYSPRHMQSLPTTFEKYLNSSTLTLRRPSLWSNRGGGTEGSKARVS